MVFNIKRLFIINPAWVWLIGVSLDMKLHVVKEVTSSNHTWDYMSPMLVGGCGAPRGIVVAGKDPWSLCHASTSPVPSCRFP